MAALRRKEAADAARRERERVEQGQDREVAGVGSVVNGRASPDAVIKTEEARQGWAQQQENVRLMCPVQFEETISAQFSMYPASRALRVRARARERRVTKYWVTRVRVRTRASARARARARAQARGEGAGEGETVNSTGFFSESQLDLSDALLQLLMASPSPHAPPICHFDCFLHHMRFTSLGTSRHGHSMQSRRSSLPTSSPPLLRSRRRCQ